MKYRLLVLLVLLSILSGSGCYKGTLWRSPTALPMPGELTTTLFPPDGKIGELDAVFISQVSVEGVESTRCHKLYRFYPDGLVLYSDFTCLDGDRSTKTWSELDRWFSREDQRFPRGDYSLSESKITIRIVSYNSIYETLDLRIFVGEICGTKMVLQEPSATRYTGIPSELTQPVLEFAQLELPVQPRESSGLTSQPPESEKTNEAACHVAGFLILKRPTVVIAGSLAEYQILTDPGETCSLIYAAPGGESSQAPGSVPVTADNQGVCGWIWELGDLPGEAIVTITIDEIQQDFLLEIRSTRAK